MVSALILLVEMPVPASYDLTHLRAIHQRIFSDIYEWAGSSGTVAIAGLRVDQPPVFVAGLVSQRVADLLKVQAAQVQHQARIDRSSGCSTGGANARFVA